MYYLPNHNDEILQTIITSEMIRGLKCVYFDTEDRITSLNILKEVLRDVKWSKLLGEEGLEHIHHKLIHMYHELLDMDNQYAFDDLGQFLLHKTITYLQDAVEQADAEWVLGANYFDTDYLGGIFAEMVDDIADEDATDDEKAQIFQNLFQATSFIYMGFCGPYPEFIYEDADFLMYKDALDISKTLHKSKKYEGMEMGAIEVMPVSGSFRFSLYDDEDEDEEYE